MSETATSDKRVIVIGAGPAGLSAAYELTNVNVAPIVLEQQDTVGGLAQTRVYNGFHFDMGGHRFFSKIEEIRKLWREMLGADFLRRPRLSRIYCNRRFFYYPLKPLNVLRTLGLGESVRILVSYLISRLFPYRPEDTFEHWVTNRFGKRLFSTFFKTYTEKVWGIPCTELRAEWAAQRIKDLSLTTAVVNMFVKPKTTIKTLIEEFDYPRRGPGMMWQAFRDEIERRGGLVRLDTEVVRIKRTGRRVDSVVVTHEGGEEVIHGTHFIGSMPITTFIQRLDPPAPDEVRAAAAGLGHRDFLTVCLIVRAPDLFPDNWIYVHDPAVRVARIQNFKNWSPDMVPDPARTSLGLEYFCTEGDALWTTPDAELIEIGKRELARIGLAPYAAIEDGCVVRVPKAYPIYDSHYRGHLAAVRRFVDTLENFQTVGRNGLHRYNNQDHAMLTGLLAARNLMLGHTHDLWSVNTDQEYHEVLREPIRPDAVLAAVEPALPTVFPKLDHLAFGGALSCVTGVAFGLVTLGLALVGAEPVTARLQLLDQYLPGYAVTPGGSLLGLLYGAIGGFFGGFTFAVSRNALALLVIGALRRRLELQLLRKLFE